MTTLTIRTLSLAAAVALACGRTGPSAAPPERIDEPAAQTIETLARSPHGLNSASREDRARLDQVRRDPAPYLAVIRQKYAPGTVTGLARDRHAADAFMTTSLILAEVEPPAAADLLASWWIELDDGLLAASGGASAPLLARMQDTVLAALGARPRDAVISRILEQLERMDRRRRVDSLHYLIRSRAGNAEVIRRLRAFHDSTTSPLHGDRDVANAIARLSGAR